MNVFLDVHSRYHFTPTLVCGDACEKRRRMALASSLLTRCLDQVALYIDSNNEALQSRCIPAAVPAELCERLVERLSLANQLSDASLARVLAPQMTILRMNNFSGSSLLSPVAIQAAVEVRGALTSTSVFGVKIACAACARSTNKFGKYFPLLSYFCALILSAWSLLSCRGVGAICVVPRVTSPNEFGGHIFQFLNWIFGSLLLFVFGFCFLLFSRLSVL